MIMYVFLGCLYDFLSFLSDLFCGVHRSAEWTNICWKNLPMICILLPIYPCPNDSGSTSGVKLLLTWLLPYNVIVGGQT